MVRLPKWRWLARLTATEPVILVSLLVLALGTWGFIELADEVLEGDTSAFDEWVVRSMRQPDDLATPIGPPWVQELGRDATAFGGLGCVTLFVVVIAGYLCLARKTHMAGFLVTACGGGMLASGFLKALFNRPRPDIVPHLSHVASSSFPSGHSMMAAVTYLTLGALVAAATPRASLRIYVLTVALLLAVVVGVSRVYLGVHYPTDVLAGWAAGLVWALGCWLVARQLQRKGQLEKPNDTTEEIADGATD